MKVNEWNWSKSRELLKDLKSSLSDEVIKLREEEEEEDEDDPKLLYRNEE